MNKPYAIKIFLPGGDPNGLRTIEKSSWNGCGLVVPRALFGEARKREDWTRAGVYVLVGPPENSGLPRIYVGEGDPIGPRLEQHAVKKDFWITAIAFTSNSKDAKLNKAHVQYLEARLVKLAAKAKRCVLDNGNEPQLPSLSESDQADAEGFFDAMMLCFPVLGLDVFTEMVTASKSDPVLHLQSKGIAAQGTASAQGFVVHKGSRAVKATQPSCQACFRQLRDGLIGNGVLKLDRDGYVYTQDYPFSSPSTAAGVTLGRAANGRTAWKTKDGRTLKELQDGEVSR